MDEEKYDEAFNQRDKDDMIAEKLGEELKPPTEEYIFNVARSILATGGQKMR